MRIDLRIEQESDHEHNNIRSRMTI